MAGKDPDIKPPMPNNVLPEDTPALEEEQGGVHTLEPEALTELGLVQGEMSTLRLEALTDQTFSPIELRDRVVIMLLFDQVVREDQVELAWHLWQQMGLDGVKEPLWRVLTLFPELDRELVYAEAARVYGFEEARISRPQALALIHKLEQHLDQERWNQLVDLRVVPIAETEQPHRHRSRMIFATQDPTRPEVHRLMSQLNLAGFELRYARESEVVNLLIEAFPHRYNHLKGLSGVTKDFLAGLGYSESDTILEESPATIEGDLLRPDPATSPLYMFEEVLVEAVKQHATDVCLLPTPNGQATEVYFQIEDELTRRRVVEHFPAKTIITAIKSAVIRSEDRAEGKVEKRIVQRWIEGARVRFRVSAVPPSEEVHSECIVVRVFA